MQFCYELAYVSVVVPQCKHVFVATEQPSNCRNSSAVPGKSDRSIRDVWLVSFFPGDLALSDGWLLTTISLLFAATSKSRFPTTCTGRRVPSLVLGFNHLSHCVVLITATRKVLALTTAAKISGLPQSACNGSSTVVEQFLPPTAST